VEELLYEHNFMSAHSDIESYKSSELKMQKKFNIYLFIILPLFYPLLSIAFKIHNVFTNAGTTHYQIYMMNFNCLVFCVLLVLMSYTFFRAKRLLKTHIHYVFNENKKLLDTFYIMFFITILTQVSNGFILPWWFYAPSDRQMSETTFKSCDSAPIFHKMFVRYIAFIVKP